MRRASWKALLLATFALFPALAGAAEVDPQYKRYVHRRVGSQDVSVFAQLAQRLGGCDRTAPFARSHALLIGVGRYRHLPSLDSPARDVTRLRDFLLSKGGFDEVVVLQDDAATPEAISYFMEDYFPSLFSDPDEAGRFLFYFSGHGATRTLPGGEERGYLRLANNREGYWSDAVGMDEIGKWAANVRGARHSLFLIDSCVSGLAGVEYKGRYETEQSACDLIDLQGSLLLTAGQADERALGGKRWGGSLFTEAFLTGLLEGSGDVNGDNLITTLELFTYVRDVVSRESGRTQHPGLKDLAPAGRGGGELFFLRARPVRLPPPPPAAPTEVKAENPFAPPPPPPPPPDPLDPAVAVVDLEQVNLKLQSLGFSDDVYFSPTGGNAELSYSVRLQLQRNASLLKLYPHFTLRIEGHTSSPGTNESNLYLGQRRADAVRDYLVSLGVASSRLRTLSYGEERPVCITSSVECHERNTRAHMVVDGRVPVVGASPVETQHETASGSGVPPGGAALPGLAASGPAAQDREAATSSPDKPAAENGEAAQSTDRPTAGDSSVGSGPDPAGNPPAYTVYLTDGSTLQARAKYRRSAAGVIVPLLDGSETFLALSRIDVERTERLKDREQVRRMLGPVATADALREAFDLARGLADALPADPEAQCLAVEAAYRLSQWTDAATFARRGGDPGDDRPELLFYYAVAFYETGDKKLAAAYLRRSLPNLYRTPYVTAYVDRILSEPPANASLPAGSPSSDGVVRDRRLAWLGFSYSTVELTYKSGKLVKGVQVGFVDPASRFAKELWRLDVITEVNGEAVHDVADFEREMRRAKSGSFLRFYVWRTTSSRDGAPQLRFAVVKVP